MSSNYYINEDESIEIQPDDLMRFIYNDDFALLFNLNSDWYEINDDNSITLKSDKFVISQCGLETCLTISCKDLKNKERHLRIPIYVEDEQDDY